MNNKYGKPNTQCTQDRIVCQIIITQLSPHAFITYFRKLIFLDAVNREKTKQLVA